MQPGIYGPQMIDDDNRNAHVGWEMSKQTNIGVEPPSRPPDTDDGKVFRSVHLYSSASYWFAAAAATGGTIRVRGLANPTAQGDAAFLDIIAAMGCSVSIDGDEVVVVGPEKLRGGSFDCNATPDATFGYRYHTSDTHPYIVQCLVGQVDLTRAPRVAPLGPAVAGPGKPTGSKPPGGVMNLALVEAGGTRTMTYDFNGQRYTIQYTPASTPRCWDFAEKSFTTGGVLTTSTWCRQ